MAGFLDARPRVGYFYAGHKERQIITDYLNKMFVKDYKALPVIINENTSIYDAIVTMFLEDVGTLFVKKEEGFLAGVLSRKDLLRVAIGNNNLSELPVNIMMTRMPNIIVCYEEETLYDVAQKLIHNQIDALPVVRKLEINNKLEYDVIGRITKTTITKAFVELGKEKD